MGGFDEARRLRIIIESHTKLTNADFEDTIADKGFWPDGAEKFLFGDELAWTLEEIVEQGEGFGSELNCLGALPQALVGKVQTKGIEDYPSFMLHFNHQNVAEVLWQVYELQLLLGQLSTVD